MSDAAPTDAPAAPAPDYAPRWVIGHVSPGPDGKARVAIVATTGGVSWAEVGHFLARELLSECFRRTQMGDGLVPTRQQVETEQRAALLLEQAPAVRIYARAGEVIWLGSVALAAVGENLVYLGWTDVGAVPGDVRKACMRAQDEAGFDAKYMVPLPKAPEAPATPG